MSDTFTRDLFAWLSQVHADQALHPAAFKLAYAISQYVNRKHGKAWPSQATLAKAMGITDRAVRDLVDRLRTNGHLQVDVHRGRHKTNVYRLAIKPDAGNAGGTDEEKPEADFRFSEQENRKSASGFEDQKPEVQRTKTGSPAQENRKPASDKPSEEPPDALRRQGGSDGARRRRAPDGAPPELEEAFAKLWRHYPKRQGEDAARREFHKAIAGGADPQAIIVGVMRYAAERTDKAERYTAMPANWLRDGRWKDEPAVEEPGASTSAANGGGRHRRGKPSVAEEMLRQGGHDIGGRRA
jgi:hypothetical protein